MIQVPTQQEFLTPREFSCITGFSIEHIRLLCRTGGIKNTKVGSRRKIHRDEVDRFMHPGDATTATSEPTTESEAIRKAVSLKKRSA